MPLWLDALPGDGDMLARVRATNWAETPLGPIDEWPETLRAAVAMALTSRFPNCVVWGPELAQVWNDAFVPIFGAKTPALGEPMAETWDEVWDLSGPLMDGVFATRTAAYHENLLGWVERRGYREDAYFTFCYGPIIGATGSVDGVHIVSVETTAAVVEGRRRAALDSVTPGAAPDRLAGAMRTIRALAGHREEVPFAAVYLPGPHGLALAADTGFGPDPAPAAGAWPLDAAGAIPVVVPVPAGLPPVVHALSGQAVRDVAVVGLGRHGFLVLGLSPARPVDEAHVDFARALGDRAMAALAAGQAMADERIRADAQLALARAEAEREAAERNLAAAERFSFAGLAAGVGAWTIDLRTGASEFDDNVEVMFGMTPETGRDFAELMLLIHPDDREKVESAVAEVAQTGGEYAVDYRVDRSDGVRVFQARGVTTPGPDGLPHLLHGAVWDVTDLFAAQAATRESEERLRTALEAATWGSAIIEPDGRISVVNQALCDLLGRDRETLVGMCCQQLVHSEEERIPNPGDGGTETRELRLAGADGRAIWVQLSSAPVVAADGTVLHHVVHVHDATERKTFEAELQHLADHDALTGLLNRRRFGEELERVVGDGRTPGAVVMVDLDGLKAVNDSLGHAVGDALIVTVADILRERLRDTDVAARLGGDEFAVLVPGADASAALTLSTDILRRLRDAAPLASAQGRPAASACAGIALYGPGRARTDEELMTQADLALYEAKDAGQGCARVCSSPERDVVLRPGVRWSDRIRGALAEDRFVLLGQPIRSLHGDPVERYELLLRMLGDNGELLLPSAFLLAAERSSLIQAIDRWVLRRAADELAAHQAAGHRVSFAVNLSARSMTDPAMAEYVGEALAAAGADGGGLVLEITETAAVVNVSRARSFARALQANGCELALDDFGAGFTSFRYLKHLDFDYVKIDGAFVHDLASSHTSQCLVQSLSDMAHNLGKRTIAEHVGDDTTEAWLRDHGIDYVQGFHVGVPAPLPAPLPVAVAQKSAGSVAGGSSPRWA